MLACVATLRKVRVIFSLTRTPFLPTAYEDMGEGNVFIRVCHFLSSSVTFYSQGGVQGGFVRGVVCLGDGVVVCPGELLHTPPPPRYAEIRSTGGGYASYWNAFLFYLTGSIMKSPIYNL